MEENDEDFTVMRVIVDGMKDGKPEHHVWDLLDRYDRETKITSMARSTGYSCTATVRLVAAGLFTRKGIAPPEYVGKVEGCWEFIKKDLARHNVNWVETRS